MDENQENNAKSKEALTEKQENMSMANQDSRKPVFLYTVIAVLVLAVAALGALSFLSLNHLVTLQEKVQVLSATVEDMSKTSSTLVAQADQLETLKQQEAQLQAQTGETAAVSQTAVSDTASADTSQSLEGEGMLSPSKQSTFTDNTDPSMDTLLSQVEAILPQDNGTWSVYVCNLLKNSEGSINDTPMQAASLIKLFIMGCVYENYDALSQTYGGDALDQNITSMITVSVNDAANTLVNWLGNGDNAAGMAKVNAFCQEHGYTDTQMNRMLLADKTNGDNYTSVKDCGAFLKEVYQICNGTATDASLQNAETMYYQLKMQQLKNKIPAGLPEGVHTANKTGELDTVENDAAIIYDTAKGIDLVVVFMSQDLKDTAAAQAAIAEDAHAIYGYYNE